ncbi:MAG: carboxymuconolactone decarboxylase family protein [Deltaproteobacteria bacterium]|nr:carboxymuconolactone decarboxylase family protein [Deltaproteobacteria bacterium]
MNGLLLDEQAFRASIDQVIAHLKSPPKDAKVAPRAPSDPTQAALAEARAAFGVVPEFLARFPAAAVPAAWQGLRDVELAQTAISAKDKSLIGLAVASQIPCRYCVIADTAFARLSGATDEEIAEAVAMSSFVRLMSTYLNGLQVDETGFEADVNRLVRAAKKAAATR